MAYHRSDWSFLAKLVYKPVVRPLIVKFVKSTSNTYDDELVKAFDLFLGK